MMTEFGANAGDNEGVDEMLRMTRMADDKLQVIEKKIKPREREGRRVNGDWDGRCSRYRPGIVKDGDVGWAEG